MTNATTSTSTNKLLLLKTPLLLLFLSLPFLLFFLVLSFPRDSPNIVTSSSSNLIRIRPRYKTYDEYIAHQLNKTLNPKLRHIWATRDWSRKLSVFSQFFVSLSNSNLIKLDNSTNALCIGARIGQEVAALRSLGIGNAIGIDLVPSPPLVIKGDFHAQPFGNDTFDFEFSNVFDHALYPEKFVGEVERTLKPGGVAVLHVAVHRRGDKYSANDLMSVDGVLKLFKICEVVRVRKVDGFGLDTEVVLRKRST